MKKTLTLFLTFVVAVSFSACKKSAVTSSDFVSKTETESVDSIKTQTDDESIVSEIGSSETYESSKKEESPSKASEKVEKDLKEEGYSISKTENKDGTTEIEVKAPETPVKKVDEKPAVPELPTGGEPSSDGTDNKGFEYSENQSHTEIKNTERYVYSTLNVEQKKWYKKIDAAVCKLETRVEFETITLSTTDNAAIERKFTEINKSLLSVYQLYMADNPEHFYLCGKISCHAQILIKEKNSAITPFLLIGYSVGDGAENSSEKSGMTEELKTKIRAKKARFDNEIDRIVRTITADAPNAVKEKMIYDYIILNAEYNQDTAGKYINDAQFRNTVSESAPDDWSAYGVIINKKGVCESYAEAFQLLCLKVGINCTGVVGTASGGGHKWNAVKLDSEWYMCDITFDDPINGNGGAYHNYFNITTNDITGNRLEKHIIDESLYKIPVCNGTKYNYSYFK